MALMDIIEFFDNTGEIMVAKFPQDGSAAIPNGSQLVVQQDQVAFVYTDGTAQDEFGPGRHDIVTDNIPLLVHLQGIPYGFKSPFRCHVCYVSTKVFTGLGWGTASPIVFRDSEFRMVTLRAFGVYAIRISDPRLFVNTIVGTKGMETTYAIEKYFKTHIVSTLNEVLANKLTTILDLPKHYSAIDAEVENRIKQDFAEYGIELMDFVVESITVPPEVQDMLNKATGVAAQDTEKFRAIITTEAIADAAKTGGAMGEGLGAGLGMSMGMALGKDAADAAKGDDDDEPTIDEVKEKLKGLKEMVEAGLITAEDYEEQKDRLLGEL